MENAVGGHLLNTLHPTQYEVFYFRDRCSGQDLEVDFIIRSGNKLWGLEVTTSELHTRAGLEHFKQRFPEAKTIVVGPGGVSIEEFFAVPGSQLLR